MCKQNWEWVTDEMFQDVFEDLVGHLSVAELLAIPNIDCLLREELNNDVLSHLAEEHNRDAETGEEVEEEIEEDI